jgi:hypothetical protein
MKIRQFVTFKSDLFSLEERNHHINECCRAENVGRWLLGRLREESDLDFADLYQEDFGWVIDSTIEKSSDVVMIIIRFFEPTISTPYPLLGIDIDDRITIITGFFRRKRRELVSSQRLMLTELIDKILHAESGIEKVEWWHDGFVCGVPAQSPK